MEIYKKARRPPRVRAVLREAWEVILFAKIHNFHQISYEQMYKKHNEGEILYNNVYLCKGKDNFVSSN